MWYAPNVLTQIPQKKELTMTVKMELTGKEAGDFGGIGVEGHIYGYARTLQHRREDGDSLL